MSEKDIKAMKDDCEIQSHDEVKVIMSSCRNMVNEAIRQAVTHLKRVIDSQAKEIAVKDEVIYAYEYTKSPIDPAYVELRRQLKAKDALIEWVSKTSVTLFEAKDRCEKALKGE